MSQSATLYRVSTTDFDAIAQAPLQVDLRALCKEYVTLQGTHEGFRFLLSIGRDAATVELVSQLFYPAESVGEIPDPDTGLAQDEADLGEDVIHYNSPGKVMAMGALLAAIDAAAIGAVYDANELNENDIYPGHWSATTSVDIAFNVTHLLQELPLLKGIYARAAAEGDYVLCFVG